MSYNPDIPSTGASPSDQYVQMQQNYKTAQDVIAIDHVTFAATPAPGTHKQVTFNQFATPVTPVASGASVAYPVAGNPTGASSATAQMMFQNTNTTLLLSAVRAFGCIQVQAGAAFMFNNQFNVNTGTSTRVGNTYTIQLNPNAVTGTNAAVFITSSNMSGNVLSGSVALFSYVLSANQLVINMNVAPTGTLINFVILQA